jgi:hypothetical protein
LRGPERKGDGDETIAARETREREARGEECNGEGSKGEGVAR